ncbi:MAG: universal stress protein [Thermodesulfobacteriota bacterium]
MSGETEISSYRLEKVLVCTDNSPLSQGALNAALSLARSFGCQVHLLQVVELFPFYEFPQPDLVTISPQLTQDLLNLRENAAREHLEACKATAGQQGVDLETRLRLGTSVYGEILEETQEIKPDLIILGRRGRTGLERLMMGSVTARVIGHSPVNVLVVPRGATLDFKRLLIASDGSSYSDAALAVSFSLARKTGAALLGVCVAREESELEAAQGILERLKAKAEQEAVVLEPRLLQGRPFEALVRFSQEEGINLIILGSHGHTGLKRLLMGSVAERVIGQTPCPVLVVKRVEE